MAGSTLPVFDNEMVMRFIRSYRENQCLWDFNSPAYKNKAARDLAYESLVCAMDLPGLTVTDVKNKIKNIRSTYCQELKKIQTAAMLGRDPYVPSVFWFKELDSFLHANTTPRTDIGEKKVPKYLVSSSAVYVLSLPRVVCSYYCPPPPPLLFYNSLPFMLFFYFPIPSHPSTHSLPCSVLLFHSIREYTLHNFLCSFGACDTAAGTVHVFECRSI